MSNARESRVEAVLCFALRDARPEIPIERGFLSFLDAKRPHEQTESTSGTLEAAVPIVIVKFDCTSGKVSDSAHLIEIHIEIARCSVPGHWTIGRTAARGQTCQLDWDAHLVLDPNELLLQRKNLRFAMSVELYVVIVCMSRESL